MRLTLSLFILLSLTLSCKWFVIDEENKEVDFSVLPAGIGILTVDIEKLPTLDFYSDTNSAIPSHSCRIITNKLQDLQLENQQAVTKWLKPEDLWLDYYIFNFRVCEISNNWILVYTNNENQQRHWIKRNTNLNYEKWVDFFSNQVTNISKLDSLDVEIKTHPKESSTVIKTIESTDCFEIMTVKGEWLKVRTHTVLDCDGSENQIKSGWIKWRKNNRLQIAYGLVC